MIIIDGKKISQIIKEEIKEDVEKRNLKGLKQPHLAAVLVGDDGASQTYVNSKVIACQKVGFKSTLITKDKTISQNELLQVIDQLNEDKDIDGYIVQLPLPKHIDEEKVLMKVNPDKDVDGFHPYNFGKMALEMPTFISATPYGIMELLERYQIEVASKHCVVIGRSHIVGRPISILMSQKKKYANATVTLAHSRTKYLEELTKTADIIITALGNPEFLKADMVKEGVVVIDVGITRVSDPKAKRGYVLRGDVEFESVSKKAKAITPVPGGVGPMTIAMLLKNTLLACQRNEHK
ncbi:MAG: bifunctional methylenetetrahydrofolate dehydrogenase/methenyltetrahydrofolate cyclohydrolase FolD [Flavobacteriaceae bacterium]|nr:bifunctional methylenetetrahydrofolate dehydrogenase/methenyltetrahydrofolate cyclohydrolase FolD [Flavobacteriaceae bacterium]MCY4215733.1 bifunctional methylenetetrahydrofolate dehydrogenase/methenyltetrahydrofolate cyclohydrolase FolD [Flavobacteriaceae bacterium]